MLWTGKFFRGSLVQIAVSTLLRTRNRDLRRALSAEHCRYGTRDLPPIDNLDRLSLAIFFIAYHFHPGDGIAIEFFCDGGMRHRGGWRGSVPVLCSGWNPDDIPFSYLLNMASPLLNPTKPGCNDQSLAEGVCMPHGSGTRFECHARANCARWINRIKQRLNMHRASKVCCCPLSDSLRTASRDLYRVQVRE